MADTNSRPPLVPVPDVILVGELNPYGADPRYALYPLPEGASGWRLAKLLGMDTKTYLRAFERTNLCAGVWDRKRAMDSALRISGDKRWRRIVMLGRKVTVAFFGGKDTPDPFTSAGRYIILPHPSGRNLVWNRPGAAEEARALLVSEGIPGKRVYQAPVAVSGMPGSGAPPKECP